MMMLALLLAGLAVTGAVDQAQGPALPGAPRRTAEMGPGEVPKRAPINGVLVLYGNERCPTNTDGDEIVICERRSAQEQYRMPKELREFVVTPENAAWAAKVEATTETGVGANSVGSCSVVGAGGQTGCAAQQFRTYGRANTERKVQARQAP
jgi:hypothetical protein